jgi:hypothetical protein
METVEQVRLEIGDTEGPDQLFTPEQVEHFLDIHGGEVLAASAHACDVLATRFVVEYDFSSAARQQFKRSQKSEGYERRAKAIRLRIGGGLVTVPTTRVDGFSEDITTRDGAGESSKQGRIREGYTNPDIPY